ncbi:MAG: hypothetical protein KatS3mg070_1554 [Meiothermus sp.]|uniref:hypothetical protein n=1 Tax=Meiothermus sp. TaxID=1955249 RepID=UPI0021DE46AC|nr:hypothetical protein [Meiothermus sp.]GIW28191.1 MAG: hypothetical protein KatS3mg070_1554 [Meiothermus sp.]
MNPWAALFSRLPEVVARLEAHPHPLLLVEVDGEVVARLVRPSRDDLARHSRWPGMPRLTAEEWLHEALSRVMSYYPAPRHSITLLAGPHPVAVVRRKQEAA